MNRTILILLALVLNSLAFRGTAQSAPPQATSPTLQPGPAWTLTPEQLAERQKQMQVTLAQLRMKRDNGTITMNEKAWLERVEQAGGWCVNGIPRGPGGGTGLGRGNGTGPRAQLGLCPLVNTTSTTARTTAGGGRGWGRGGGGGYCGGRGWGRGGGWGLQNGTGPRAPMGLCPLLATPPTNSPAASK